METENLFSNEHAAKTMSLIADKAEAGTPLTDDERQFVEALEKASPYIKAFNDKMDELKLSNEERYVLNFLLKANGPDRLNEMDVKTFTVLQLISMEFVHYHKEQVFGLFDQEERNRLKTLLNKEYAIDQLGMQTTEDKLQSVKSNLEQSDLTVDDILEHVGFGNAIHLLYGKKPSVNTYKAENHLMPNDKITNTVFGPKRHFLYDGEPMPVGVEKRGSKNEINTLVSLKYLDDGKEVKQIELEPFDFYVLCAIASLRQAGNTRITPLMVARHFGGNFEGDTGSKGDVYVKEISKSIERLFYINIEIDATEESNAKGSRYRGPKRIVRRLLPGGLDEDIVNGQKAWCYISNETIPLIEYAEGKGETGQIITFETKLLNIPIDDSKENTIIKEYLLKRIGIMKGKSAIAKQRKILYETLFNECNISSSTKNGLKKKKVEVREKIKLMLDEWVKQGHIAGYRETRSAAKGRPFDGIEIIL